MTAESVAPHRREAIACLLTASEGWRDAARMVGGAFAGGRRTALTSDQEE